MEETEFNGHMIKIDNNTLTIDGNTIPYTQSNQGYQVFYEAPKATLMEAAREYVKTQRGK